MPLKNTTQVNYKHSIMCWVFSIINNAYVYGKNGVLLVQVQHVKGLPMKWEGKLDKVHQLFSKAPLYNKVGRSLKGQFLCVYNQAYASGLDLIFYWFFRFQSNMSLTLEIKERRASKSKDRLKIFS